MNSLSWLIYLAGVSENLAAAFFALCLLGLLGTAIAMVASTDGPNDPTIKRFLKPTVLFVGVGLLSCLFPSQKTVYMIAGSQAGGELVQTPEFAKVRLLINQKLDDALKDDKNEED